MFDAILKLSEIIFQKTIEDKELLEKFCSETIKPRTATAVSILISDNGKSKLQLKTCIKLDLSECGTEGTEDGTSPAHQEPGSEQKNRIPAKVTRVIDGDTLEVLHDSKVEDVRLIGVDTPETKHPTKPVEPYGTEASAFAKQVLEGKNVYLEFDAQQRDKYGRLLCYLYLEDGTFFNAELVSQGYAKVLTVPPNVKYSETFVQLQQEARENHSGLWSLGTDSSWKKQEATYIGSSSSKKFHRPDCQWGQKIADHSRVVFNSMEEALDQGYASCKVCCVN